MSGSLNGQQLLRAAVTLPSWGVGWADVVVASSEVLTGAATLELAGLELACTILPGGGVHAGEGRYLLVCGAAGWRKALAAKAYRNAAGQRLATVLRDAATECGETLGTLDEAKRIGPGYVRVGGVEASRVLDELASEAWYVDADGVTQIGPRPAGTFTGSYVLMGSRPERRFLTIASDDLSTLLPGVTVEGMVVASVRHELGPDGLRSHLHGVETTGDAFFSVFRRLVEWITGRTFYLGSYEYKVRSYSSGHVDIDPVRASLGLPKLASVPVRTGIPGGGGQPAVGSSCVVRFLDGDPTMPYVADLEGQHGSAWLPVLAKLDASTDIELGQALGRVLRSGDKVAFTIVPASPGQTQVVMNLDPTVLTPGIAGPPGVGYSKVKA